MSDPKKHHFLPQFYLNQFKISPQHGKYPHIWMIEKIESPKPVNVAIRDTGCMRDYHTLDYRGGDKDRKTIEQRLSDIESKQAELIGAICETLEITERQKEPLAELINLMRFRVPSFKFFDERFESDILKSVFDFGFKNGLFPEPHTEIKKGIEAQGSDFIKPLIDNRYILNRMFNAALDRKNLGFLKRMRPQLLIAPNEMHYLTCDSPVSLYHPEYESIKPYGVGPGIDGVVITFPISKKHLVKCSWSGEEGTTFVKDREVYEYNRRTLIMANRQIYASDSSQDVLESVSRYHNLKAGFIHDTLSHGSGAAHIPRFIPVTNG